MHQSFSMNRGVGSEVGKACFPVADYPGPAATPDTLVLQRENAALKEQVAALTRSNAELEQFAWSASHDLKEPLRTVAGYTQLLLRRRPPAPGSEEAEFAAYVLQGVERMHAMIDGLLEYARTGAALEPSEGPGAVTDTSGAASEAVEALHHLMEECGASVSIAPLPAVAVARTALLQIFSNLIGNALKYRSDAAAPCILVSAESYPGMARFAVRDNGIGIDPEFQERIFLPFQRLHGEEYPGIGLGLALTRRLVERCGGEIWVESEAGGGSTFRFTLPAAVSGPEAAGGLAVRALGKAATAKP